MKKVILTLLLSFIVLTVIAQTKVFETTSSAYRLFDEELETWSDFSKWEKTENVIITYITENNPDGDFKESTIGADDKRIWWCKGAKALRDNNIPTKD